MDFSKHMLTRLTALWMVCVVVASAGVSPYKLYATASSNTTYLPMIEGEYTPHIALYVNHQEGTESIRNLSIFNPPYGGLAPIASTLCCNDAPQWSGDGRFLTAQLSIINAQTHQIIPSNSIRNSLQILSHLLPLSTSLIRKQIKNKQ